MNDNKQVTQPLIPLPHSEVTRPVNKLSPYITAISNFSVQYNFQAISIALLIMSSSLCTDGAAKCVDGDQAEWVHGTATATVFIGAIAGQLSMGYAGDVLGRTKAMTMTLSIATVSALLSALVPTGSTNAIYATVIAFRFFLGIGLGGVYPLSATKAAEDGANSHGHADSTAASKAFFWQAPGSMGPWLVAYLLSYNTSLSHNLKWRLLLALGSIPAGFVVILSVLEAKYYPSAVAPPKQDQRSDSVEEDDAILQRARLKSVDVAEDDIPVWELLKTKEMQMKLLATGGGWFLYDVAYYGVALFGGQILSAIGTSTDDNVSSNEGIRHKTSLQLTALSVGIPAQLLFIFLIKPYGTKLIQVVGFILDAVSFFLLAACFKVLRDENPTMLFVLYCFLMFNLCGATNISTFVLPAETYDKRIRATFNGISAAMGKLGAAVGCYLFGALGGIVSYPVIMIICGVLCVLGAIISQIAIVPHDHASFIKHTSAYSTLHGLEGEHKTSGRTDLDRVISALEEK